MQGKDIRITSSSGGEFDCYLALPELAGSSAAPAIVLAAAVHGVDGDIRAMADEFATMGYVAAAPDLFWRTIPGPLGRDDKRTNERSRPREEVIAKGEQDLLDTLAELNRQPAFNGRAAVIGFYFGGPYAIIGTKRLGFHAGIACHGTAMLDYIGEMEGVEKPVSFIWGDRDARAPAEVLDAYRALAERMDKVELKVFPGVQHGFMMKADERHDAEARAYAMARAAALLSAMR